MGLFSGKTVTTVNTSVSRAIDDASIPNSLITGMSKNIFGAGDQMVEYSMEEMTNSIGLRAGRMYEYGQKTYTYGLPTSTLKTSAAGKDASQAAIQAELGVTVTMDYYHFGAFNNLHAGWVTLVNTYGYNSLTNQIDTLSATKGAPVFLVDMQVVVTNATLAELANGSMEQWGVAANAGVTPIRMLGGSATPFAVDPAAGTDYIRVDYCWQETTTTIVEGVVVPTKIMHNESLTFPVPVHDVAKDYHQARYLVNGKAGYWTYQANSGVHPAIDAVFDTAYSAGGTFFPITYFRFNAISSEADKTLDWYKQSKKMVNYLNMDFDAVANSIDQNPDVAQIEQAMLMMAVPATTTNPLEQRYLFDFFSGIYDEMVPVEGATSSSLDVMGLKLALGSLVQETSIIIQDARFKMALSYKNIVRNKVAGSIGAVGTYASGSNSTAENKSVPMIGGGTIDWSTDAEHHWYRSQVSETVYEEILVHGLKMTYWVFDNYTTTGTGDDATLLIPLNQAITSQYTILEREQLYARSLQYIFNSKSEQHLKWYQTGIFKALTVIIAIALAVVSYGQSLWAFGTAVLAGTVTSVMVWAAITTIIENLLIKVALTLFVKIVGVKIAFIAAIVAACYGIYKADVAGGLANAPWAKELLTVANGLTGGITKNLQEDFNDLLGQAKDLQIEEKADKAKLDAANALLDTGLHLSPLVIFGESPTDFYQRTVHSGNIGTVGIDVVSSFVDVSLTLPKLSTSVKDLTTYGV